MKPVPVRAQDGHLPPLPGEAAEVAVRLQDLLEQRRFDLAKAAMQGLIAAEGPGGPNKPTAEHIAARSVRYAEALLDALNKTTAEATHARPR